MSHHSWLNVFLIYYVLDQLVNSWANAYSWCQLEAQRLAIIAVGALEPCGFTPPAPGVH